jgi:hypothetical protein
MPRALRRIAFYVGAAGVLATPLLGCALSVKGMSAAECVVLPDGDRVSMSSVVRSTPYATAFAASGTLALAALTDALTEYDTTLVGRALACAAFLAFLVPFAVPLDGAGSVESLGDASATSWAHAAGALFGCFCLWVFSFRLTQKEMNVAALTVFAMYTASAGVAVTGTIMDALRTEGAARQLVQYGTLYGEFGAAGATLGLFNYVTRDATKRKLFNL